MKRAAPPLPKNRIASAFGEPSVRNAEAVLELDRPLRFVFRGQTFEADVSFEAGVELIRLTQRMERYQTAESIADVDGLAGYLQTCRDAVDVFGRIARPEGPVARLLARRWNPFRRATELEISGLLLFFAGCRMKSSVRPATARHGARST